jgi:cytochrome c oxidase assembly factor CtaG
MDKIDIKKISKTFIKYLIEGFSIIIVAYYIPILYKTSLRKPSLSEILKLGFIASFSMFILDYVSEKISLGARLGMGFEIGRKMINL